MKEIWSQVSVLYKNKNSNSALFTFPGTIPIVQEKKDKKITWVTQS